VLGKRAQAGPRVVFGLAARDPGNVSPPVVILCAFDRQTLHRCGAKASARLKPGKHVLRAVAIDAQDNRSRTTVFRFSVAKK
jgi:hypothetical protein